MRKGAWWQDRTPAGTLRWLEIVRLGLVQTALGAIVVLTTSTLNRVMVVEWQLAAMIPGALVALHYAVQITRPKWGHGSDVGQRRTPWIVGGMGTLAIAGVGASAATALMGSNMILGLCVAVVSFLFIGVGVGASGTSLLALLASRVTERRRAAAATIVWLMMIAGMAITATIVGKILDPFSPLRLLAVTGGVCVLAFLMTCLAVRGVEDRVSAVPTAPRPDVTAEPGKSAFKQALLETWAEPEARRFTIFVFMSMLAYSAQDLILEPFAGLVFGMTPGETTSLAGMQHQGVFFGMLGVAIACSLIGGRRLGSLRMWTVGGCVASALALFALAMSGSYATVWPLKLTVFALGLANGAFAVAAIGSMMALAGKGRGGREGTRMGLWGAAQAIAFGLGGFAGTVAIDAARAVYQDPIISYAIVFTAEGALFLVAALLATQIRSTGSTRSERETATRETIGDFKPNQADAIGGGYAAGDD